MEDMNYLLCHMDMKNMVCCVIWPFPQDNTFPYSNASKNKDVTFCFYVAI